MELDTVDQGDPIHLHHPCQPLPFSPLSPAHPFPGWPSLPFTIYSTFVVEENHGFNKQTAGFFAVDQVKKFFVSQAIQAPILAGVIKIVYWGGDYFFVYLWGFVVLITLFLMTIYPDLIAPLFDKYTPMPEGELKGQVEHTK